MNMDLFREIFELNQAFEQVTERLKRMESVRLFPPETARETRADVLLAQIDFNRQFFDKFHNVYEQEEEWACAFKDQCVQQRMDPEDAYLEIRRREETRKNKGLPPRVTFLPELSNYTAEHHKPSFWRRLAAAISSGFPNCAPAQEPVGGRRADSKVAISRAG